MNSFRNEKRGFTEFVSEIKREDDKAWYRGFLAYNINDELMVTNYRVNIL